MFKNLKDRYGTKSGSNSPNGAASDRGQDLTTILDRSQRGDLTVLVALVIESMRNALVENFNVPAPQSQDSPVDKADASNEANNPVYQDRLDSPSSETKDPKLAADALQYFDDWRDAVLLRIGEVVNKDFEPRGDASPPPTDLRSEALGGDEEEDDSTQLYNIYSPVETPLSQLPKGIKLLVLHSMLLLLLSLEHYSAHSRVLLLRLVSSLRLSLKDLNNDEIKVARGLLDAAVDLSSNAEAKELAKKNSSARKWKVGIASVAGAALIGITGGLAAPLVAAGLGTVMGGLGLGATAAAGYLGALAGSSVVVGGLFGAYGGRMTGRMMDKYAREVEDFAFIPIRGPPRSSEDETAAAQQDHRLRVTIGITGWAIEEDNLVTPWRVIGTDSEVFALRWELESLLNLGNAIRALVRSAAWSVASREILSRTIFAQIMSAVVLPLGLLKIASVVDNPFSVAKARADKAGKVLADALINKAQGERPVTLIGYSLGSRAIFSCLQHLAKRRAYGLVESVILMGSPIPSNAGNWRMVRNVVSGRLVNVYSQNDSILALLYRTSSFQLGIAGLQPVEGLPGVENVDVSGMVSGHLRYQHLIGKILGVIGLERLDPRELAREEAALAAQDRQEEEERVQNERQAGVEHRDEAVRQRLDSEEGVEDELARLKKEAEAKRQQYRIRRKPTPMELRQNQASDWRSDHLYTPSDTARVERGDS